jgi:hypothetical protein
VNGISFSFNNIHIHLTPSSTRHSRLCFLQKANQLVLTSTPTRTTLSPFSAKSPRITISTTKSHFDISTTRVGLSKQEWSLHAQVKGSLRLYILCNWMTNQEKLKLPCALSSLLRLMHRPRILPHDHAPT